MGSLKHRIHTGASNQTCSREAPPGNVRESKHTETARPKGAGGTKVDTHGILLFTEFLPSYISSNMFSEYYHAHDIRK